MIKVGNIMTTIEKKEYPYTVEIIEIYPCKTKAKCLWTDTDGCGYKDYEFENLRHLSAKEIYENVFRYFGIKECHISPFYSKKHLEWLRLEAKSQDNYWKMIERDCEKYGMNLMELPCEKLWEYDHAKEVSGWMTYLAEIIEREIKEVMEENPASNISVSIPVLQGKFVATPSMDENYPGIDVEFIPSDMREDALSFPRVLMEYYTSEGLHAHIWSCSSMEDCSTTVRFQ